MNNLPAKWVFKKLHGIVCVYKPVESSMRYVQNTLKTKLCADVNTFRDRPPDTYVKLEDQSGHLSVTVEPSFADNVKVIGPRYQAQDFAVRHANFLGSKTSGVIVLGINGGIETVEKLKDLQPTSTFQVKAEFGKTHYTLWPDSKVRGKATYDHVKQEVLEKILASIQAAHQKAMFMQCGFDIHSQECYEMAVKGLVRPIERTIPVVYGIKCIEFEPPQFTLEVQCINMNENYLLQMAYDIGLRLKTLATCTGIRCIRYGCFTVKEALLLKHLQVQEIFSNMRTCKKLLGETYDEFKSNLVPEEELKKISEKNR